MLYPPDFIVVLSCLKLFLPAECCVHVSYALRPAFPPCLFDLGIVFACASLLEEACMYRGIVEAS